MEANKENQKHCKYFIMLDLMQESGQMNMFGAPAKLRELYPELAKREAMDITTTWMKSKTTGSRDGS